jgi:Ca2+-binding RTX toxin-like protein
MLFIPSRRSLAVVVVALICLIAPTAANTAGQIVIYGAGSGSNLKLHTHDGKLIVKGWQARHRPKGCHFTKRRMRAVCNLSRADRIELQMGNHGDFVRVKSPLPIPLTVHLGGGSDKFIGNAENDTCYSEGSRRNRCVGGPGRDICITGNKNSDCVGGPGNDYCRHGAGSDGCWGGPGNDICIMGPGQDGCHGGPGNDRLYGGRGADQLYGGSGQNYCDGLPGIGKSHSCNFGPRH